MSRHKEIQIKRIYEDALPQDGYRILVDRLWPRGIAKECAALDEWDKQIAPSTELRKWFNHQEEKFAEFTVRYRHELTTKSNQLMRLNHLSEKQKVTLLYAAKSVTINHAVILKQVILEM